MKESVAIAKDADAKKDFLPTKSEKSIHRVRNEPEKQLGSLRSVIDNIRHDGGTPSLDSIATELSSMHTAQRASVLLALQRTHGNQYVQRVVTGIQAKLKVGQPGDKYEQEADRVAEQVVRMPEDQVQRQVEPEEEEEEEKKKKEEELIQPKENSSAAAEVTPGIENSINSLRGGGQPLPESVRNYFEPRLGYDFSQARIHTDADADTLNRALNARAFTTGQDIFFRQETYNPGSSSGRKLLVHELTHVVQQTGKKIQRKLNIGKPGDRYEQEADQMARAVVRQEQQAVPETVGEGLVHRQVKGEEEEALVQTKAEYALILRQAKQQKGQKIPAEVNTSDIEQEIDSRLTALYKHVNTAIHSFENWFNKTKVKVDDLSPFAKFLRDKMKGIFGILLTGPYVVGAGLVYEIIAVSVDKAIADKIKSIKDFRKNMTVRFLEKITTETTKKQGEIKEKLADAVATIDQTKVNVENHDEVVDAVTTQYFKIPNYKGKMLWPQILTNLVEAYLTFYWSKKGSLERGIMLSMYPGMTFKEIMEWASTCQIREQLE
jgi:hypothetical protein